VTRALATAIVLATGWAASGCARAAADARAPNAAGAATRISGLTPAQVVSAPALYQASGTLRGRNTAVITSKVTGYVRSVRVRPGDRRRARPAHGRDRRRRGRGQPPQCARAAPGGERRPRRGEPQRAGRRGRRRGGRGHVRARAQPLPRAGDDASGVRRDRGAPAPRRRRAADGRRAPAAGPRAHRAGRGRGRAMQAAVDDARLVAPFAGRVIERHIDPGSLAAPGAAMLVVDQEGRCASTPPSRSRRRSTSASATAPR